MARRRGRFLGRNGQWSLRDRGTRRRSGCVGVERNSRSRLGRFICHCEKVGGESDAERVDVIFDDMSFDERKLDGPDSVLRDKMLRDGGGKSDGNCKRDGSRRRVTQPDKAPHGRWSCTRLRSHWERELSVFRKDQVKGSICALPSRLATKVSVIDDK